ncbi:MAG: hypothetical protein NTV71_05550 [Candidatus Omnitrophica bacterium]|nr:hypothetical protein [Candidatus Omnitrophota bacterium]
MRIVFILILLSCCLMINTAFADETTELKEQIKELTQAVKDLKNTVESQQKDINSLKEAQNIRPQASLVPASVPQLPSQSGKFTPEIGAVADMAVKFEKSRFDTETANRVNVRNRS